MIASLPMYLRAETRAAHEALWTAIRRTLPDAPEALSPGEDILAEWRRDDLVLGQICGLPLRMGFWRQLHVVGALDYGLPGLPPGYYESVFVVRDDGPADLTAANGAALAYNAPESQSGWAVVTDLFRDKAIYLAPTLETGSHRASAQAVAEGRADVAALDCLTWRDIIRYDPEIARALRVVGRSQPRPGMALVTADLTRVAPLRHALTQAIPALPEPARQTLGVTGFVPVSLAAYLAVPLPPTPHRSAETPR